MENTKIDHKYAARDVAREYTSERPVKLSLKEAGELLGFSYPTMLALANREDFPAFKCMGKWIIPYDKLMEWMRCKAEKREVI